MIGLAVTGGRGGIGATPPAIDPSAKTGNPESASATALGSGGRVGPSTRRRAARRSGTVSGSRRMGDGRAGRSSLCALPTMAFFVTPNRRPISAVE